MVPSPLKTWLVNMTSDVAALTFSVCFAVGARSLFDPIPYEAYLPLVSLLPIMVFYFYAVGLYPGILLPPQEELRKCVQGITCAFVCVWTITFFSRGFMDYSRLALLGAWALACLLVPLLRFILKRVWAGRSWWGQPVVVCGEAKEAVRACRHIERSPRTGLKPVAIVPFTEPGDVPEPHPPFQSSEQAVQLAGKHPRPYALILMDYTSGQKQESLMQFSQHFKRALFILTSFSPLGCWMSGADVAGVLALEVNQKLLDPARQKVKRIFDIFLVVLFSPFILGLVLVLSFLIWWEDHGPVFYSQRRIGKNGKEFRMWKFRSMVPDADKVLEKCLAENPKLREEWKSAQKLRHDPRITRVGRFLRMTSLDEVPQLWNVLVGQMSLVGPRPIVANEIQRYADTYNLYTKVSPGLTGCWQISGRSSLSYPIRVWLDSYYIRNWSLWFDFYILLMTPGALLKTKNAC